VAKTGTEPIAVLLLESELEQLESGAHVRDLLTIPRVIALEPSRFRTPRLLRDAAPVRQAKRLRFPGEPRVIVLYHPVQYLLARALCARYAGAELDRLACERATPLRIIDRDGEADGQLRARLRELGIISQRPFVPWARIERE